MLFHIVEDDPILSRGLQVNLELDGHRTLVSPNLAAALQAQKNSEIDFVILDLGLPDGSGFEFLSHVRSLKQSVPVIILTAQTDEDSVVKGLLGGADDYMKKPYSFKELQARISVITRKPVAAQNTLSFEKLMLNSDARVVKYGEEKIELNRREFDVLYQLVNRAEMIVSRDILISELNRENEIFDRTIDSHISHLRKKLTSAGVRSIKISSVYGLGYRLERRLEK